MPDDKIITKKLVIASTSVVTIEKVTHKSIILKKQTATNPSALIKKTYQRKVVSDQTNLVFGKDQL